MSTYAAEVLEQDGTVRVTGSVVFTGTPEQAPVASTHGIWIPPTADPHVAGAVWNNAGTLTISAG